MIYITYLNERGVPENQAWSLGNSLLQNHWTKMVNAIDRHAVTEIEAGGSELKWILNNFHNIPTHKTAKIQTWTGDLARFIFEHLAIK